MDEKELVKKAQSGDKAALDELLYSNYNLVYGYLLKLAMNYDTARDITQEAMVKAILNIRKFRADSKFSTWLISIASNLYKDFARKRKRIGADAVEDMQLASSDDVEETVIRKDSMVRLKKALMDFPEEKRMVFILKHFYNYPYEDIARIMKCPVGTVRSRLHYCIKKLQEILDEGGAVYGR